MSEAAPKFVVEINNTGRWDVIEVATGLPVKLPGSGAMLDNLSAREARECLEIILLWDRHKTLLAKSDHHT